MTGLYLQGEGADTFSEGVSSVTNVPTVRLEATVGYTATSGAAPPPTPAKGGTAPFNTPGYMVVGGSARKESDFLTRKIRNAGLETVSHCV